jgi:hypothetical protein
MLVRSAVRWRHVHPGREQILDTSRVWMRLERLREQIPIWCGFGIAPLI